MSAIAIVSILFVIVLTAFAVNGATAFTPRYTSSKLPQFSVSSSQFISHSRLFNGKSLYLNKADSNDFPKDEGDSLVVPPIVVDQEYRTRNEQKALDRGRAFVKSIMENEYEPIPDSDGMSVLRNVVDLETGEAGNVILRSITIPFWQKCLEQVNTPQKRYKVAAIGTPGIGKTTATPILIRMLLKEEKTVVYLIRTLEKDGWFFEFVPGPNNAIMTNIYPERMIKEEIPSLQEKSTYYIVDPGEAKDSCNPPATFEPKVILVPSPDSGHWGGEEFKKTRRSVRGFFKCMPLWSLEELLSAQPVLCPAMTDREVREYYRCFGGVPRHVFGTKEEREDALCSQDKALNQLSSDQAKIIASGNMDALNSFLSGDPKSSLMGYDSADDDNGTFSKEKPVLLSPFIEEKVYSQHMACLWETMKSQGKDGWKMFEAYTRSLMMKELQLQCYPCVGKKGGKKITSPCTLGGCTEIYLVLNPISGAKANDKAMILFHSARSNNPLFDFVYKEANGHFHVFQATVGTTHTADPKLIEDLQREVGGASNLSIYYLVPSYNFANFVTVPVNPKASNKRITCDIWHVLIPEPGADSRVPLVVGSTRSDTAVRSSKTAKPIATRSLATKANAKKSSKPIAEPSNKKTKSIKRSKKAGDIPT